MPKVTVIPATKNFHTGRDTTEFRKRRVAAYARVSTNSEEQATSYEAQVDFYTKYIKSRSDWEFVKVYTDKAITGTSTKHRKGFNDMIENALAGNIDLIVTKSISRFARNTVDTLVTVRKLKERGIEVFFEKENIYTLDSKGELLITIMSSLAQDESRSISDNITWGQRKRFADGKVNMPYAHFLGYQKGADELPEIVPEEAEVVRLIYALFLEGKTPYAIAEYLTELEIPTPAKKTVWKAGTVISILQNEKYKGSAILQKRFTVDFLTKKMKVNEGEVPQYYIEESHPAIIEPTEFEIVQAEIARRRNIGNKYSGNSIFAAKLVCGDCGSFYGPKVWHSTDKYRRVIYRCNCKYERSGERCKTPTLTEDDIKAAFLKAMRKLLAGKEQLLDDCREMQTLLSDTSGIYEELRSVTEEYTVVGEMLHKLIESNSRIAQDQTKFWEKFNPLEERFKKAEARINELRDQRQERLRKAESIGAFMFELHERGEQLEEFDNRLWIVTVDTVKVMRDGSMVFNFRSGVSLTVEND